MSSKSLCSSKNKMYAYDDALNAILNTSNSVKDIYYCLSSTLSWNESRRILESGRKEYYAKELGVLLDSDGDIDSDADEILSADDGLEGGEGGNGHHYYYSLHECRQMLYFGFKQFGNKSRNHQIIGEINEKLLLLCDCKHNNNNHSNKNNNRKKSSKNGKNGKNRKNVKNVKNGKNGKNMKNKRDIINNNCYFNTSDLLANELLLTKILQFCDLTTLLVFSKVCIKFCLLSSIFLQNTFKTSHSVHASVEGSSSSNSSNSNNSKIEKFSFGRLYVELTDLTYLKMVKKITTTSEWKNVKRNLECVIEKLNLGINRTKTLNKVRIDIINDELLIDPHFVPTKANICDQCNDLSAFLTNNTCNVYHESCVQELIIRAVSPFYSLTVFDSVLNSYYKNLLKFKAVYLKSHFQSQRYYNAYRNISSFYKNMIDWNMFIAKFRYDCAISGIKITWLNCDDKKDENNSDNNNNNIGMYYVYEDIFRLLRKWHGRDNIGCKLWFECTYNFNHVTFNFNENLQWLQWIFAIVTKLFQYKFESVDISRFFKFKTDSKVFDINKKIKFKLWYHFSKNNKFKVVLNVSLK